MFEIRSLRNLSTAKCALGLLVLLGSFVPAMPAGAGSVVTPDPATAGENVTINYTCKANALGVLVDLYGPDGASDMVNWAQSGANQNAVWSIPSSWPGGTVSAHGMCMYDGESPMPVVRTFEVLAAAPIVVAPVDVTPDVTPVVVPPDMTPPVVVPTTDEPTNDGPSNEVPSNEEPTTEEPKAEAPVTQTEQPVHEQTPATLTPAAPVTPAAPAAPAVELPTAAAASVSPEPAPVALPAVEAVEVTAAPAAPERGAVQDAGQVRAAAAELPRTGASVLALSVLGSLLVLAGIVSLLAGRRLLRTDTA